jgi:hypothetical protein
VRTILIAVSLMVILSAACGQASSPVERQEKQGGVERQEKQGDVEQTERRDTLTEEELSRMNPYRVLGLFNCQLDKLAADKGKRAAEDYAVKLINESGEEGTDATPVQIKLWREGYTCTPEEIDN